jgi:hypothetical protein
MTFTKRQNQSRAEVIAAEAISDSQTLYQNYGPGLTIFKVQLEGD